MEGFLPGDRSDDLQETVDLLLEDEFVGPGDDDDPYLNCPTQPLRSGGVAGLGLFRWHSRMIDIVDMLLNDEHDTLCEEYPNIAYCRGIVNSE